MVMEKSLSSQNPFDDKRSRDYDHRHDDADLRLGKKRRTLDRTDGELGSLLDELSHGFG